MKKDNFLYTFAKQIFKFVFPSRLVKSTRLFIDLYSGKFAYSEDCLYTYVHADFLTDQKFMDAYKKGHALMLPSWGDYQFRWRAYIVCWVAEHVRALEGEFVECGVNTGMLARMIIDYINFPSTGKQFYLLDTYEGMAAEYSSQDEMQRSKHMGYGRDIYEQVKETFASFNVRVIKGVVPDTLQQITAEKICFLSIDMNSAIPERKALEYFWDKLVSGGVVVLDDYGFPGHEEQKRNHDEFAKSLGVQVLALPTGQGLIFKP